MQFWVQYGELESWIVEAATKPSLVWDRHFTTVTCFFAALAHEQPQIISVVLGDDVEISTESFERALRTISIRPDVYILVERKGEALTVG